MKKIKRSTLDNKCLKLWGQIVIDKAGHKCEICGNTSSLAPHHVIGRKNYRLRHDPRNGVCLCYQHHVGGNQSAHNDPQWFLMEWFAIKRTKDYNYVWEKKTELATNLDYEEVLKKLNACQAK